MGQVGSIIFAVFFLLYLATSLPSSGWRARSNASLSYKARSTPISNKLQSTNYLLWMEDLNTFEHFSLTFSPFKD